MQVYARFMDANADQIRSSDHDHDDDDDEKEKHLLFIQHIAILPAISCTAMNILWIHLMKY